MREAYTYATSEQRFAREAAGAAAMTTINVVQQRIGCQDWGLKGVHWRVLLGDQGASLFIAGAIVDTAHYLAGAWLVHPQPLSLVH